ncbi:MAG: class I SAM-dependent methyltransferase [Chloroflexi bacterium]|jgi:SAM-dependent methyltransferase|nr:class I SAM-dependent methyltransferase [Chloroflexota bacterium]MBT7080906.1 class I SAM-dependent methyltransferase [Chloroflexota bacterium]MBT7289073.1 class I SAM-dependent methyltransferase [Chloroflexota bacterium]
MLKSYEKLSEYYYDEWGNFSLQYLQLLDHIASEYGFSPDSILDIACGTGNLLSALNGMGKQVVGCDMSPQMIAIAKKNNPDVEFHTVNMIDVALNRKFDLAVCAFDSINYLLSENDVSKLFSVVYAHLANGGIFLFDVNTQHIFRDHAGIFKRDINGTTFTQTATYDGEKELACTVFDFGTGEIERHVQKAYDDETIAALLEQNSFEILDTFANIEFAAPTKDAKRLIYVVRKC